MCCHYSTWHAKTYGFPLSFGKLILENTETPAEVLLLAVYHTVISLQNLTTNEHVPNLMHQTLTPSNVEMTVSTKGIQR